MRLLKFFSLPYARQRPLKVVLTILGMAIGIAVFTAIDLSNRSVVSGLEYTVRQTAGASDLTIIGQSRSLTDDDYLIAAQIPGISATPVLESQGYCAADPKIRLNLLGIDPVSRGEYFPAAGDANLSDKFLQLITGPRSALIPHSAAVRCKIPQALQREASLEFFAEGKAHKLQARSFEDTNTLWSGSSYIFTDIASAQELLDRRGELSRIEVKVGEEKPEAWIQRNRDRFPGGLNFSSPEAKLERGRNILKAFQLNLTALSLVAVFVAGFIVYNAASLSLLYRRSELGTLRALGANRGQIAGVFSFEILLCGLTSSLLGIALGWLIAKLIFSQVLRTVQDLYLAEASANLVLTTATIWTAIALGMGASLLGAALPLIEAFRVAPAEAVRRLSFEKRLIHHPYLFPLLSLLCWAAAWAFARASSIEHPGWSFESALAVLLGFLFWTSAALRLLLAGLGWVVKRLRMGAPQVALAQIAENPYRFGVVTAAFSLGVALWIGVGMMIFSFRDTVNRWVEHSIRGDIYLTLRENRRGSLGAFMPDDFRSALQRLPGLQRMDTLRGTSVRLGGEELPLSAIALNDLMAQHHFQLQSGSESAFRSMPEGIERPIPAAIAESLARRHRLKVGEKFSIETSWGTWTLRVGAVLFDYTSERGLIYIDRAEFIARSKDPAVNGIALYLHDPGAAESLLQEIAAFPSAPPSLVLQQNRQLKRRILDIFDQTFRVTEALKIVALFVAFLGILSTLATLLEEKRREVGLLQSLGTSPPQLSGFALTQGLAIALAGFALGAICGLALCMVILKVIHWNYFGWTIHFRPDTGLLIRSLLLTLLTGAVASLWAMRWLRKLKPAEALRFDE